MRHTDEIDRRLAEIRADPVLSRRLDALRRGIAPWDCAAGADRGEAGADARRPDRGAGPVAAEGGGLNWVVRRWLGVLSVLQRPRAFPCCGQRPNINADLADRF